MDPIYPIALRQQVLFIDIGGIHETYFTWSNPDAGNPFSKLDFITAKSFPGNLRDHIHLKRQEKKLVARQVSHPERGFTKVFLVIGTMTCQYQVMEALLDFLGERWFTRFETRAGTSGSCEGFEPFTEDVTRAFEVIPRDFVAPVRVYCSACDQYFEVYVKRALITNADSFPVPLVFEHANHALLLYVDKNFQSHGESTMNITG